MRIDFGSVRNDILSGRVWDLLKSKGFCEFKILNRISVETSNYPV